jgi:hypothetical protein
MAKIKGQGVVLDISSDGGTTWKVLICLLSNDLNMTRETLTAPFTKCDTATAALDRAPGALTWEVPFDALIDDAPISTQLTYGDLLTLMNNGTTVMLRQQYDNTGSDFYTTGSAILTSLSQTNPADGFAGFSGTFSGSGALDIAP